MATVCEPIAKNDTSKNDTSKNDAEWYVDENKGRAPRPWKELMPHGISWPVIFWLGFVHLGALLIFAPQFFSWWSVGLMVGLHWLTGGIGICLGYHRLFTHRSFQTTRPMRYLLATLGGLAGEGSCLNWVSTHRRHHAFSDDEGDPHSPHDGAWWSHILWTFGKADSSELKGMYQRWIPDLVNDRFLWTLDMMFIPNHLIMAGSVFALGTAMGGTTLGCSFVVWGIFARLVFVMHSTWLVNSASHIWGYRNYETTDDSRNNWMVAAVTYGEGWHNNHHAYPTMARHGHKWWEIDLTFIAIRAMKMCGLAWEVVDHKHKRRTDDDTLYDSSKTGASNVSVDAILQAHRSTKTGSPHHEPSQSDAVPKA